MTKIFLLAIFSFITTFSFAQTDSTFCGKWKISVVAGEKHPPATYMLLKKDSTFITSGDSTFADQKKKASEGKWKVTSDGELKLIPSDTSRDIHYYNHVAGWKFKYSETGKNGVKKKVMLMEMDVYVEKMVYVVPVKKSKKK